MRSTAIERRAFLRGAGAAGLMLFGALGRRAEAAGAEPLYLSGCRKPDGSFAVAVFRPEEGIVRTVPLPDRGHDICVSPGGRRAIAFARRPGTFACAIDLRRETEPTVFHTPEGRHFYGHGDFSPDGRLLFATENDYDNARGTIGIYDARGGYARLGEIESYGVGPHEVVLMPDGRTLAIGNGGIETHPAAGRTMLNVDSMQANLAFVDWRSGDLIARHALPPEVHKLSIRHVSLDADGRSWFGCQYVGPEADRPPLVGYAGPQEAPRLLAAPNHIQNSLMNYVGAMATSRDGQFVAASCPRGGKVLVWNLRGELVAARDFEDSCGIVSGTAPSGFLGTNGLGEIREFTAGETLLARRHDLAFDNHVALARG
ncbi:DUF1513 domain-containing protein [Lutibaculum baratangense]|uniref:Putative exported protein n=1 Tax=Lutibaculum baratangense AMV1 TaxID=631454 RepID=V4RGL6_9HYPH|nr:DUF1513 domain-containing protein [Lutibaculum baratangense]ESR22400.1 putative exported protein [Lutibaculum baratangense AMV1]